MTMKPFGAGLTALVLVAAAPAAAQTLTGAISGVVRDEQGAAVAGATVTVSGKTGARTTTTDPRGEYRFATLDPGVYSVRVELGQFQPQRQDGLTIAIGRQLSVDFTLKLAGVAETIEVSGEAPLVDVTSSATAETLSQDFLFNLPLGRSASALLNYVPGVNDYSAFGGGDAANGFYLDGVSTRSPGGGSNYVFMNYNIIEDFQVQGLGAPAEYGSFRGAIVNYVSRSGGNDFSALFDAQYTTGGLASDNIEPEVAAQNPSLRESEKTTKLLDVTAQLSGPLVKDKLFFFLSGQRYQLVTDPTGPRGRLEQVTPRLNAKLTWEPRASDTLTAAFQGEDYNYTNRSNSWFAGASLTTDALSLNEDAPDRLWSLQWRHLFGSRTFLEAKYHGYTAKDYYDPAVPEPLHWDYAAGEYNGGGGYFSYADRKQHTLNASLSHYAEAFGRHDFKFGVEIERSRTRDRLGYIGGFYYYDNYSFEYYGYTYGPYSYAYSYGYDLTGDNHRESFYVQDSWKVNDRLTVNAGLRLDRMRGVHPDIDEPVYKTNNLAPRLGVAFDLTGDHKTVLRAFYGQYYEALLQYQYYRLLPGVEDQVRYFIDDGVFEEIDRDPRSSSAYRIDPDIKHPRVDEFNVSFERALGSDLRFSATGVLRDNKNFIGSVIPGARWSPIQVENGLTGQPLTVYEWANEEESENDLLITNPDGFVFRDPDGNTLGTTEASARYRALIFSLEKRLSNSWQARVSYVLSKSEGTVEPTYNENIGFGRQFETPTLALVNFEGPFIYHRPHELKLLATYEIPRIDLNVNAYYRWISGYTYTPYQRFGAGEINFIAVGREPWLEPRGSRRLDAENLLDLRFEKTFKLPGGRLGLYADIYNVFNSSWVDDVQIRYPSISISGTDVAFGAPDSVVAPRQVTFGARWSF